MGVGIVRGFVARLPEAVPDRFVRDLQREARLQRREGGLGSVAARCMRRGRQGEEWAPFQSRGAHLRASERSGRSAGDATVDCRGLIGKRIGSWSESRRRDSSRCGLKNETRG